MTEVFGLEEANVTTLAQMNKLPLSVAQKINDFDRQNAPQLAAIFAGRYLKIANQLGYDDERTEDVLLDDVEQFLGGFGPRILHLLKKNQSKKQQVVDLSKKDWRAFLNQVRDAWNNKDSENIAARAEMKFPDGFYWVKLDGKECDAEGNLMQHCGQATEDMYSLRDADGRPHVTLDVWPKSSSPRKVDQIRGKQNKVPDRKYWPYIEEFFRKNRLVPNDEFIVDSGKEGEELHGLLTQAGRGGNHGS